MFKAVRYLRNSYGLTFARQSDIRRKANDFEDALRTKLQGHYSQPHVISLPDELDAEVPRLVFTSRHGFSQILVSQISVTLNVTYSPDWQADIDKGLAYLSERVPVLYELLDTIYGIVPHFSGMITQSRLPASEDDKKILEHIANSCFKDSLKKFAKGTIHDLQLKTTSVLSDRFFSNLTLQNYRTWEVESAQPGVRPFARSKALERGIEITGDFNDRYAFNESTGYSSELGIAAEIISGGISEIRRIVAEMGVRLDG